MKTCPKCSAENNDDVKFCLSCGANFQSDLEKFLEAHGISQLAQVMKSNDITSLEVLKELGDNDLGDLGIAYGDKVRIKIAIESLKAPLQKTSTVQQVPTGQSASLEEQGINLLRQTAQIGINKASAILNSAQKVVANDQIFEPNAIQAVGEDVDLVRDIERTYTFIIWGWLTFGILTLVAWWKVFRNRKKVLSDFLKSHWNYQKNTIWLYLGLYMGLNIVAVIIEPADSSPISSWIGYVAVIWYIRTSWKARKSLKAGQPPPTISIW
jgi:hypothetical protein